MSAVRTTSKKQRREQAIVSERGAGKDGAPTRRISLTLFLLSVSVLLTSFGPPVLTMVWPRAEGALVSAGEMVDLLTPFVLTALIALLLWQIYNFRQVIELNMADWIPLGLAAASAIAMTEGHGIHLPTNALSRIVTPENENLIYSINYLYDEVISHYFWHTGAFGLSAAAAIFQLKYPTRQRGRANGLLLAGVVIYAFTFTFASLEGGTVPIIATLSVATWIGLRIALSRNRLSLSNRPVVLFLMIACVLMLIGWAVYAAVFGGLPSPLEMMNR